MKLTVLIQYFTLACILAAGMFTFYYVRYDTNMQLVVGIITAIAYMIWGIIHHAVQKDLHRRVVVEYILIGCIAIVLLATILRS